MKMTSYQYLLDTDECKEKEDVFISLNCQYDNCKFRKSDTVIIFIVLILYQAKSPFNLLHNFINL